MSITDDVERLDGTVAEVTKRDSRVAERADKCVDKCRTQLLINIAIR